MEETALLNGRPWPHLYSETPSITEPTPPSSKPSQEEYLKTLAHAIGHGHAFRKHVLESAEFPNISTPEQFTDHLFEVLTHPTLSGPCTNGFMYWQETSSTIVIENYKSKSQDRGTAYHCGIDGYTKLVPTQKNTRKKSPPLLKTVETVEVVTEGHLKTLAQAIGHGHAFTKHVMENGEFPHISTPDQFTDHLLEVLSHPTLSGPCTNGYMYWQESSSTIVIENYKSKSQDRGTAYYCTIEGFHRLSPTLKGKKSILPRIQTDQPFKKSSLTTLLAAIESL